MGNGIVSYKNFVITLTEDRWRIWDRQGKGKKQVVYIPFNELHQCKSAIDGDFQKLPSEKVNWNVLEARGIEKPKKKLLSSYRGYWYSRTERGYRVFRRKDGTQPVTREPLDISPGELHQVIDSNFEGYPARTINWTQVIIRGDLRRKIMAVQNVPNRLNRP